jgi:hypothetical protein
MTPRQQAFQSARSLALRSVTLPSMRLQQFGCLLGLALLGCPVAHAQTAEAQPKPIKDCSEFSSAGCSSFNQMLRAGDKGILAQLSWESNSRAYVCFEEYADSFLIVSFEVPKVFVPKSKYLSQALSIFAYSKYTEGVESTPSVGGILSMTWNKLGDSAPIGRARNTLGTGKDAVVAVDSVNLEEIGIEGSYPNVGGTTTSYSLQIRRSTLRYKETFDWNKSEISNTGRCIEYRQGELSRP